MNGFSSETLRQLQFVSGQCTWQDQDQVRTRVGAKPRQGVEDGEQKAGFREQSKAVAKHRPHIALVPLLGFFVLWA